MGKEYEYQRREDDINYAKLRRQKVMDMNAAKRRKAKRKAEEEKKLQAKMEISQPGDQHEQQADAVAKKIVAGDDARKEMNMQYPSSEVNAKQEEGTLMAKTEGGKLMGDETLQTTIDSSKGSGQNLDDKTKSEMGEKLGADLSDVKIHTGDKANEMSEGINAKAFTQGQDIYFKEGNFNTTTPEGKELLAHELAHTQQDTDSRRKVQRQIDLVRKIALNSKRPPIVKMYQEVYQWPFPAATYPGTLHVSTLYWYNAPKPIDPEIPNKTIQLSEPEIHFERRVLLHLNNGNYIRFAIYGNTEIKDEIKPGQVVTTDQLNTYMEADDSPFFIAAYDAIKQNETSGVDFHIPEGIGEKISCHGLLKQKDFGELAKIVIPAKELYDFLVSLIDAQPDIRGWVFKDNVITGNTFKNQDQAEQDIKGDKNGIVVEKDGEFSSKHMSIEDMANLADQLRRTPTDQKYYADNSVLQPNESLKSIRYNGKDISEEDLRHMFFKTVDDAIIAKEGTKLDVIIYKMEGTYFGEKQLTKEEARATWIKLDTNKDAATVNTWDVRGKLGIDVDGTFELLITGGIYRVHQINTNYYLGREFFMAHKNNLNRTLGSDEENKVTEGYDELIALSGGENMALYIRGELDRPAEDAIAFREVLNKEGGDTNFFALSFQYELGAMIYEEEVQPIAQEYAYDIISNIGIFLYNLGESSDNLESQLIQLPTYSESDRSSIISTFGYEDDALVTLCNVFSDNEKTLQIILGAKVEGYTFDDITERIKETGLNIGNMAESIQSGNTDAVTLDGELGNVVRRYAYSKVGIHLDPTKFPHDKEATSEYTTAAAKNFKSTRDQLYAYYCYKWDQWKTWSIGTLITICVVVLALVSFGIGAFIAGAVGLTVTAAAVGSVVAATVINAVIVGAIAGAVFSVLAEAILLSMGAGHLSRDKDYYGLGDFFSFAFGNVMLFAITGGVGAAIPGTVLRLTVLGGAFFAYSYRQWVYDHDGELPTGQDLYLLIYENILGLILFEVGGKMARGFINKMASTGFDMNARRMTGRFNKTTEKIVELQKQIASMSASKESQSAKHYDLLKNYRDQLRAMDEILAKYQNRAKNSSWRLVDKDGNEISADEIAAKRKGIQEGIEQLDAAEFAYKTGLKSVIGRQDARLYKADSKEAIKEIKNKHKNDKVTGPDKDGIMTVETVSGEKITYMPEKLSAEADALQTELLANAGLKGNIRSVNAVTMSVSNAKLPDVEKQFSTWKELGNDMYMGEVVRNGKTTRMYFITEESANIADGAIKAETDNPGTGMMILRASLRTQEAANGLKDYLENDWKNIADERQQLDKLKELETQAKKDGKSLNEVLETRGNLIAAEQNRVTIDGITIPDIEFAINSVKDHVLSIQSITTKNGKTGFTGVHSKLALEKYVSEHPGSSWTIEGRNNGRGGAYEGKPKITTASGEEYVKVNNDGVSSFFPDGWDIPKILAEVKFAIKNCRGKYTGPNASANEYYGFSSDGSVEIHFYLRTNGTLGSFFAVP